MMELLEKIPGAFLMNKYYEEKDVKVDLPSKIIAGIILSRVALSEVRGINRSCFVPVTKCPYETLLMIGYLPI